MYVVVCLYEGCLEAVYGPFDDLKSAKRKARKIILKPVFDSDQGDKEYPPEPKDEVYVWEIGSNGGVCHLTLVGGSE